MTALQIGVALLAGLGVAFLVLLAVGISRAVNEWKYQQEREKRYADEWVRRYRAQGDPSPFPTHRRQGGA